MNNELVQITLPLTQEGLLGAALLLVLFGVVALALFGDGLKSNDEPMVRALKAFAWVYGIVWLFVFLGTLQTLWFVFTGTGPEGHGEDIRSLGMGALIAALLGAPFVIWGTVLKHQTVMFQKEGHMTDRINKAVEQLGAEKTVDRIGRPVTLTTQHPVEFSLDDDFETKTLIEWQGQRLQQEEGWWEREVGEWRVFSETLPNIEVRIGAILSLERISQDSTRLDKGRDHVRVMEIINAYINENANDTAQVDLGEKLDSLGQEPVKDESDFGITLNFSFSKDRINPRIDVLTALQLIGRRTSEQILKETNSYTFRFFGSNFQGADLVVYSENEDSIELERARFIGVRFEYANLPRARLENAIFSNTNLCFSNMNSSKSRGASFYRSDLRGTVMILSDLTDTLFSSCRFNKGSYFFAAHMSGAPKFDSKSGKFAIFNFLIPYFSMSYCAKASCFGEALL